MFRKILTIAVLSSSLSATAMANDWYGFCYGKVSGSSSVICSPIEKKVGDFNGKCTKWAQDQKANSWGNHTGTSVDQLKQKQTGKCDKVLGPVLINPIFPGIILPVNKNYRCQGITTCPGDDGMTSSQWQDYVGDVSAITRNMAVKACLQVYKSQFLDLLEKASTTKGCNFKVDPDEI